jgi:hypothetical protein
MPNWNETLLALTIFRRKQSGATRVPALKLADHPVVRAPVGRKERNPNRLERLEGNEAQIVVWSRFFVPESYRKKVLFSDFKRIGMLCKNTQTIFLCRLERIFRLLFHNGQMIFHAGLALGPLRAGRAHVHIQHVPFQPDRISGSFADGIEMNQWYLPGALGPGKGGHPYSTQQQ